MVTPQDPNRPDASRNHQRSLGWFGTTALAMGGSNQSLFIIGALFAGQDQILGQGSAAVPLLVLGLLLSWAAAPGWIELVLMYPNRVGGISATCAEAFRPYSPVLANLTGVCYWWGWVPTCGLTAILSASAIHEWYLPGASVNALAISLVVAFMAVNLCGIRWVSRLAIPVATASALLAFLSGLAPILAGTVDWQRATTFTLTTPFAGWFGELTSLMAGLYLIGFAAPAFEAAACHVGETIDPNRAVPKAMWASGLLAGLYFLVLPLVWLGTLGPGPLGKDLALVLGPAFAPLFGNGAKAIAIWFMVLSMFSGTLQPLAGASRALSQLSEDGLLPRLLALRSRTDTPWVATVLTAAMAIAFLLIGDPIWLVAAANFTYLISIAMPSVAVWLLRRDAPRAHRPYRAARGTVHLGLAAAVVWALSALFGFEQFGMRTVLIGIAFAYSGSALYAWRRFDDRRRLGLPGVSSTLQVKLTGAMLAVLVLDGTGYLLAVSNLPPQQSALMTALADIFVAVAMLSITVALVLPGMIAHSVNEVSEAARRLAMGTVAEFSRAMNALGRGDLAGAHASVDMVPVRVGTRDEVGDMAISFNLLQAEIGSAVAGLNNAREGLGKARDELTQHTDRIAHQATHDSLTGLPNRSLLNDRVTQALAAARRGGDHAAILYLDLDGFKFVNDSYGHTFGDGLLKSVAARLSGLVRESDTIARLGGDEFVILLPQMADAGYAIRVADKVLSALAEPLHQGGRDLHLSASIGISVFPEDGDDYASLLQHADVAMYSAKATGRNKHQSYSLEMGTQANERMELEAALRVAIAKGQLDLHYQPQVHTASGRFVGVEALLRWNHPTLGPVRPDQFIPLAEETGLINPIGDWVLRTACAQAKAWHDAGFDDLVVAVNISARQLQHRDVVSLVREVLQETGLPPRCLELELTESALMQNTQAAIQTMRRIKELGVRLALDDFGTGYSSLSYLKRFPIDVLKIDRTFTVDLTSDDGAASIIRAIIAMATSLNMTTVAEGVETAEQLDKLASLGCDVVQGYFLGRPVRADVLSERFERDWQGRDAVDTAPAGAASTHSRSMPSRLALR